MREDTTTVIVAKDVEVEVEVEKIGRISEENREFHVITSMAQRLEVDVKYVLCGG